MKRMRLIAIITALFMMLSVQGSWAGIGYAEENGGEPSGSEAPSEPLPPTGEEPVVPPAPEDPTQPEEPKDIELVQPEIKAVSAGITSASLSWEAVKDASGYQILSSDTKTGTYETIAVKKGTSYTHKNLKTGKTYYYKVQAYQKIDGTNYYSQLSDAVKAVPLPKAPSISLTAGGGQITVKWKKISGVTGYEVYRSSDAKGKFTCTASIKPAGTVAYTNKKLGEAKTYYFKVRAYKTVDGKRVYSPFSAVKKKKTLNGLEWRVDQVYKAATKKLKSKSKIKRLRACYDYMINGHFGYTRRGMVARGAKGWQARYAEQFLKDKTGNCFGWAATFYYLAKKCGYEPRIYSGSCHYRNGNTGRHGWTEITINGRSYIFDPEMHWSYIHRVGSYYNGWKRVPGTTAMRYIK